MAGKNLGSFTTPMGASGNIFSVNSWFSMILGTVVLFVTFGLGQKLAQKADGKFGLDTNIEQPWKGSPVVLQQTSNAPSRVVY